AGPVMAAPHRTPAPPYWWKRTARACVAVMLISFRAWRAGRGAPDRRRLCRSAKPTDAEYPRPYQFSPRVRRRGTPRWVPERRATVASVPDIRPAVAALNVGAAFPATRAAWSRNA